MYEIWTYAVSPAEQGLLRGVGRRSHRIRRDDGALERYETPTAKPKSSS